MMTTRFTFRFIFALGVLLLHLPKLSLAAHATALCVQLGQANSNALSHYQYRPTATNEIHRHGPWTIGAKKFNLKYDFLDFSVHKFTLFDSSTQGCPYKYSGSVLAKEPFINWCPADNVNITIFAVEQCDKGNACTVLQGWLQFEVSLAGNQDSITAIYIQVRDERFNAIGTFVSEKEAKCVANGPGFAAPSEYQKLPCSAMGPREPKNSQAVLMAIDAAYEKDYKGATRPFTDYLPTEGDVKKGVHFLWKLDEYWCNRHARFRPEVIIFTAAMAAKNMKTDNPQVYRKTLDFWLKPKWYGASDIKLPKTTLQCNQEVKADVATATLKNSNLVPWLYEDVILSKLDNDYIHNQRAYIDTRSDRETLHSCQADVRLMFPNPEKPDEEYTERFNKEETVLTFAGRCLESNGKIPNHFTRHDCKVVSTDPQYMDAVAKYPNLFSHSEYLTNLSSRKMAFCGAPCQTPETQEHVEQMLTMPRSPPTEAPSDLSGLRVLRNQTKGLELYSGRVFHSIIGTLWMMFILPVGHFASRYFKETFMNWDIGGLHVWFFIHLSTAVLGFSIFCTSVASMWQFLGEWGRSTSVAAILHRVFGYLFTVLLVILAGTGGVSHRSVNTRKILITAHSAAGFTIYFGSLVSMIISGLIPGSPMAATCDPNGQVTELSGAFYLIVIWTVLDVLAHVGMSLLQYFQDKKMGIIRFWWCPIVPILPADSNNDLEGSKLRKILLCVYASIAFIIATCTAFIIAINPSSDECQLGAMLESTCKNLDGCSAAVQKFLKYKRES